MSAKNLIAGWLQGRATAEGEQGLQVHARQSSNLDEKLRRAYRWITERAILSPYVDMEFGSPSRVEQGGVCVDLHDGDGYSSFILLPLLNLIVSRRMVLIGAPGRGKTSLATLMALLAGDNLDRVRRSVQHGHPQLTNADLLGSPVPSELIRATDPKDIRVAWRDWISQRVKIIDEYNRIPTKTQASLLSLMAEGYAEMYEQVVHAGQSAWYLTANDELGGGTFPVIEALRDRIDIVARCTPFHTQHLQILADRTASAKSAEEFVPADIIFNAQELEEIDHSVRAIPVPPDVLEILGFFLSQLDFCRQASRQVEYMNKDTLQLAGRRVAHVCTEDCPLDKHENLCSQTENGVSPRSYQSILHFSKALAFFRSESQVSAEDLRQIVPWVLLDKVRSNGHSQFFQTPENKILLTDKISWMRQLFDRSTQQHAAYQAVRKSVRSLLGELASGLDRLNLTELRDRASKTRQAIQELLRKHELNGPVYSDLLQLKHGYSRCMAQLKLMTQGKSS